MDETTLAWMIRFWAVLIVVSVALDVYYLLLVRRVKRECAVYKARLTERVNVLLREFYADPLNPKWYEDTANEPTVLH